MRPIRPVADRDAVRTEDKLGDTPGAGVGREGAAPWARHVERASSEAGPPWGHVGGQEGGRLTTSKVKSHQL